MDGTLRIMGKEMNKNEEECRRIRMSGVMELRNSKNMKMLSELPDEFCKDDLIDLGWKKAWRQVRVHSEPMNEGRSSKKGGSDILLAEKGGVPHFFISFLQSLHLRNFVYYCISVQYDFNCICNLYLACS